MTQLQPTTPSRKRKHKRSICLEGYQRDDGLWEIEARLTDVKDQDYHLASGVRPAGEAVHDMKLCLTFDRRFDILAARAEFLAHPYDACSGIAPDYGKLVGMNLVRDFRRRASEMFSDAWGCAHVTELLSSLPAIAVHTVASQTSDVGLGGGGKPPQLDRCHALQTTGVTVRRYYPRWYRESESGGQAQQSKASITPTSKERA